MLHLIRGLLEEPSDQVLHCLQMEYATRKPFPDSEVSGVTDSGLTRHHCICEFDVDML